MDAIARESEIKKWRREKKVALIRNASATWVIEAPGFYAMIKLPVVKSLAK
jgi:predicted GIY-YIG superfamily endonuclease